MRKGIFIIIVVIFSVLLASCDDHSNNSGVHKSKGENDGKASNDVYKVVIDPGHGGKDKGATGASGKYEKKFTLSLSKKLESLLEQEPQIEVYMTRDSDAFISQSSRYRPKYANRLNADIFLSIHGNTFSDPKVSGTETFYYHRKSLPLAQIMQKHVAEATGFQDRGVNKNDLFVVRDTKMPAVLIEVGFLTNPHDEAKMYSDSFQKRVAASIIDGIKEYRMKSNKHGIENWLF